MVKMGARDVIFKLVRKAVGEQASKELDSRVVLKEKSYSKSVTNNLSCDKIYNR